MVLCKEVLCMLRHIVILISIEINVETRGAMGDKDTDKGYKPYCRRVEVRHGHNCTDTG